MRSASVFVSSILIIWIFTGIFPIQPASAVSPVLRQVSHSGVICSASPCTLAYPSNVLSGSLLVVGVSMDVSVGSQSFNAPTDTQGNTWSVGPTASINSRTVAATHEAFIASATAGSSAADTVSVAFTGPPALVSGELWIWELTGIVGPATATGSNTLQCGTCSSIAISTSSTMSFNQGNSFIVSITKDDWTFSTTKGTGFDAIVDGGPSNAGGEYCPTTGASPTGCGSVPKPTNAPATNTFAGSKTFDDLAYVAAVFDNTVVVVTVVAACTFFELQCWWYPLLFMAIYSGMLLMIATWVKASPKGKAHIFLSALTYGSLIAVILGIMNIVFPLLMLVLNTIIVLRLRGH